MIKFLLLNILVSVIAAENECSRFHYEEQTLKKMVRIEIAMEKVELEMAAVQRQVLDTLQDIKKQFQLMQEEWQNEKERTRGESDNMKNKTDELSKYVNTMEILKGPSVAFRSKDVADTTPNGGEIIVFKTTNLNKGDGYDNITGTFTAPVGGTYIITVQLCVAARNSMYYAIVAENEEIKKGLFADVEWNKCYTSATVAIIKPGGRVWVKCSQGSAVLIEDSSYWNTFSGVLVI